MDYKVYTDGKSLLITKGSSVGKFTVLEGSFNAFKQAVSFCEQSETDIFLDNSVREHAIAYFGDEESIESLFV